MMTVIAALMLFMTGFSQSYTFQVDGYVYTGGWNLLLPVVNQPVTIVIDSTNTGFGYQNTVYTDEAGYFVDYVALPPEAGMAMVHVSTYDSCLGTNQVQYAYWVPGTTLPSFMFVLCANTPPICQSSFYYEMNPADLKTITFINTSIGGYTYSYWDFGDGTFSDETNPTHYYAQEGIYIACLTISDSLQSCYDVFCLEVWAGDPGGGWDCENYFYYNFVDSLTMEFEGFLLNQGEALSYEWDFGDGTTGSGQTITHTFTPGGNAYYDVCLSTMTLDSINDTCRYISCQQVYLFFPPDCFNYFYYDQPDSLTVTLYGEAYWNQNTPPDASHFWDFGDGTTGSGQEVTHTYPAGGNDYYTVCLTSYVFSPDGDSCVAFTCQDIYLDGYPPFDCYNWFDYTVDSMTAAFNGYLMNGQYGEYTWEFGDGTTGTGQQITHTYSAEGPYLVTLMTVDSTGCSWTTTLEVWIGEMQFSIYGYVYLSNDMIADDAIVRLMTMDTLWQNVIEVANTTISENGYYLFEDVPMSNYCFYYVQAELTEGSAHYDEYIPTYHLSAMTWMEAWPVMPLANWSTDIYMIPANPADQGEGNISGTIMNLGTRANMEGVEVLLLDTDMNPYTYLRSDANGQFAFDGLAFGTYTVYAEMLGIETTPAVITLSQEQASAVVEIRIQGNAASYEVLGTSDRLGKISGVGEIYPNPATETASLQLNVSSSIKLDMQLLNQTGQVVYRNYVSLGEGSHTVYLPMQQLQPGIYMLKIASAEGDFIARRIVRSR